jgi:hypothetical protein
VFLLAAIWRAGMDWQATIGKGYAFRLGTLGSVISGQWPDEYAQLVESLKLSGVPFAWNPVGAVVMSLPLALVLATVAAILWLTRPRASRRAR